MIYHFVVLARLTEVQEMICLDKVDVLTYSEYMQTLSSGNLEDTTTNIQADLEVDAEVARVRESMVLNTMIYHIYSTYL